MILVTGGAGFIGTNFILDWLPQSDEEIINLDNLTYAGNLENLTPLKDDKRHIFIRGDICDSTLIISLLTKYKPRAIINFAAESHVDRSIKEPEGFIQTNLVGTFRLLEATRAYWDALENMKKEKMYMESKWMGCMGKLKQVEMECQVRMIRRFMG